jgi:hypothetical protein
MRFNRTILIYFPRKSKPEKQQRLLQNPPGGKPGGLRPRRMTYFNVLIDNNLQQKHGIDKYP